MKKSLFYLSVFTLILISTLSVTSVSGKGICNPDQTTVTSPGISADTTVTVTIVKIDLATNTVSLNDQSGELHVFTVDPALIDLRKFKVGQKVTATISTTWTTNKVTRARISKTQLIRLQ